MSNNNPLDARNKKSHYASQQNAIYKVLIQKIIAEQTNCYRCYMLSFCEPKCVSWRKIVSILNTTKVPTPARARKGLEIKQYALIPKEVPDELVTRYREEVSKIDTGIWDSIQVKRIVKPFYKK